MAIRGVRRSPEQDAAWRRAVDEAKQRYDISAIVRRTRKVVKVGREMRALCAFHHEKSPSMYLNDAKGIFFCFGCAATGDIINYVMLTEGLGFVDALRWLGQADLPIVDQAARAKAAAEEAEARTAAITDARFVWSRCGDVRRTPAERYLRQTRGITIDLPPTVRFGEVPTGRDADGRWKRPYPALVLACTDHGGEVVGLQRVFLRDDGADKRWGKKSKLSLGRPRGFPVRLSAPGGDGAEVIVTEGPEDGLTLAQELPGREIWATLGTAMMIEASYPPRVRSIVIAGQNDAPGRAAAATAEEGLAERGFTVKAMFPAEHHKDWNDQLLGICL